MRVGWSVKGKEVELVSANRPAERGEGPKGWAGTGHGSKETKEEKEKEKERGKFRPVDNQRSRMNGIAEERKE